MDQHRLEDVMMANMGTMHAYFYWDYKVQLLFNGWSSQSRGSYALSLAAVFVLALFHQWFAELKKGLMKLPRPTLAPPPAAPLATAPLPVLALSTKLSHTPSSRAAAGATPVLLMLKGLLRKRVAHLFLLTLTHVLWAACGYLLMLAVMSFNLGVFFSALAGLALGFLLFETHHL